MSDQRRRLEGAEEEVRKLLTEAPPGSAACPDQEELRRHLLVLDRIIRKAVALGEKLEAAQTSATGPLH